MFDSSLGSLNIELSVIKLQTHTQFNKKLDAVFFLGGLILHHIPDDKVLNESSRGVGHKYNESTGI